MNVFAKISFLEHLGMTIDNHKKLNQLKDTTSLEDHLDQKYVKCVVYVTLREDYEIMTIITYQTSSN